MNRLAVVLVAVLLVACGQDLTGPGVDQLTGSWSGLLADSTIVELAITTTPAGQLSGCVAFSTDLDYRPHDRIRVRVLGRASLPHVSVVSEPGAGLTWRFDGEWLSSSTLEGTSSLDGRGSSLTLSRAHDAVEC